jgi:hypothetical protein
MNPPPSNRPPPRSKEIAPEFRKYGDSFDRLDYVPGKAAIYQRESPCGHVQFEIWKLRLDKDGYEVPPSASQWGTYGWTYLTEEGAWEKYRALLQIGSSRGSEGLEEGGDPQEDAPAVYGANSSNQGGGGKAP